MKTLEEFDSRAAWESPSRGARDAFQADTCTAMYLRDIGQAKRLMPQEEIELAGRIKKGNREARDQMIASNLRLDEEPLKTLDEIADGLGVSSECVRQLQNAARKKIRCRINNLEYRSLSPARLRSGNKSKLRL